MAGPPSPESMCVRSPLSPPHTLESEQGAWVVEFGSTGSHGLGSFSGSPSLDALSLHLEPSIKAEPSAFRNVQ